MVQNHKKKHKQEISGKIVLLKMSVLQRQKNVSATKRLRDIKVL